MDNDNGNNVKSLAEKKRGLKAAKMTENEPRFKIEILAYDNDDVAVDGDIGDPILFMKIMAGAINAVVDFHFRQAVEAAKQKTEKMEEESRIILPKH